MALPIAPGRLAVTEVRKPNVGETKPAGVTCEVRVNLSSVRGNARAEWDQIKQHDVLYLLAAEGPAAGAPPGEDATPAERHGLKYARGAEVIEVRDGEGRLYNDFTGRVKPEDAGPPRGEERVFVLALDAAQYQLDANRMAESDGEDVYAGMNILLRRKPKENNFKAILECIRDLTNADVVVPEWLHDIFLGYGDPAAAQPANMPNQLRTVDFKDTFSTRNISANLSGTRGGVLVDDGANAASAVSSHLPRTAFGRRRDGRAARRESYVPPDPGPYPENQPNLNRVRFTPVQVEAIATACSPV